MSNTPIADHALLADRHSTALIDRSGSVEWLSFPRFDSPSVFHRLAFSHIGLVNAAWAISQAQRRA
jgi:GH15 family glucan-1,4-alpha-glucosidase